MEVMNVNMQIVILLHPCDCMIMKRHNRTARSLISHMFINYKRAICKVFAMLFRKKRLFCFVCKLMESGGSTSFTTETFNPWKHAGYLIHRHDESSAHNQTLISLLVLKNNGGHQLVEQTVNEQKYWNKLSGLLIEVIKFVYSFVVKKYVAHNVHLLLLRTMFFRLAKFSMLNVSNMDVPTLQDLTGAQVYF